MDISENDSRKVSEDALEVFDSKDNLKQSQWKSEETNKSQIIPVYFNLQYLAGLVDSLEQVDYDCK